MKQLGEILRRPKRLAATIHLLAAGIVTKIVVDKIVRHTAPLERGCVLYAQKICLDGGIIKTEVQPSMFMSLSYRQPKRHCEGFFMDPAMDLVECFRDILMKKAGSACSESWNEIAMLFDEVDEAIVTRASVHSDAYHLARRAVVASCHDPIYIHYIDEMKSMDSELKILARRFRLTMGGWLPTSRGGLHELIRLSIFLVSICHISEGDCYETGIDTTATIYEAQLH